MLSVIMLSVITPPELKHYDQFYDKAQKLKIEVKKFCQYPNIFYCWVKIETASIDHFVTIS